MRDSEEQDRSSADSNPDEVSFDRAYPLRRTPAVDDISIRRTNSDSKSVRVGRLNSSISDWLGWDESTQLPEYHINGISPACPATRATIEESHRLYKCHFRHEAFRIGMALPEYMLMGKSPVNMCSLMALAEQFRASPQRQWVYERAESVSLESLNFQTFCELLRELFQEGGITWERVLVLFFFCSDLSIRAFRERLNDFLYRVYDWTCTYIDNTLSYWVEEHGGWSAVLARSAVSNVARSAVKLCCFVGVVIIGIYILRRNVSG